jgi:Family of unknown function (DUF6166)
VGVVRNGEKRTLTLADERYLRQESFEWGYDGAGPAPLAQATSTTSSASKWTCSFARIFMQEVVARLPSEFEFDGRDIARWLSDRLSATLREEARASL